jgi:hypothetical protein
MNLRGRIHCYPPVTPPPPPCASMIRSELFSLKEISQSIFLSSILSQLKLIIFLHTVFGNCFSIFKLLVHFYFIRLSSPQNKTIFFVYQKLHRTPRCRLWRIRTCLRSAAVWSSELPAKTSTTFCGTRQLKDRSRPWRPSSGGLTSRPHVRTPWDVFRSRFQSRFQSLFFHVVFSCWSYDW